MNPLCALFAPAFLCDHASAWYTKRAQLRPTRPSLESKDQSYANAAGQIADQQKRERMRACAEVLLEISPTKIAT
ncbi:MAG: hypothetical protein ACKVVO_01270 [Opitutaceae bacterium]